MRTDIPVDQDANLRASAAGRARFQLPAIRHSGAHAVAVERRLVETPGVRGVRVYPRTGNVVVWHDPMVDLSVLAKVLIKASGEPLHGDPMPRSAPAAERGEIARLVIGGAALALIALRRLLLRRACPLLGPRGRTLATLVAIFTGYPFLRGALRSASGRQGLGTDLLVTVASVASLLLRENVVALTVLWLLNVGELLQTLTLRRTRRAIEDLLTIGDDYAWLVADGAGTEVRVPLERLRVGDVVAVYEQTTVPVDGEVVAGEAVVGEAAVTGESMPIHKQAGEQVWAGSTVQLGSLRVRAVEVGRDTAVGRIITRMESAQADPAPIQTLAGRFSRRFVPTSFALAAATWLVTRDPRRAMTMLLIACPCAAGLSTPTTISAAIGNGARRGILIKGGTHLESAGRVTAVVFDKTGTLTVGRPLVTDVVTLDPSWAPARVLAFAASGELHARHPLAQAVVRHTEEQHIEIPVHEECEVLLGMGVRADLDGNRLLVGSPELLARNQVPLDREARRWVDRLRQDGKTVICLAHRGRLAGLIGVTDQIRPEAPQVLAELRELGVHRIVMLTGDSPEVAAVVARRLGIVEWRAQVLPDTKVEVVHALQAEGYLVAMVSDGTNDAPALAFADVGIAMGLSGTDVAVETADVALAGSHLSQVSAVIRLGRGGLQVIRQNYGMAIGVNALGLFAGAAGALNPVLAAVLHNASSVAVVANSARLIGGQDTVE
jgi:manganese/zinc-transporting P-type ATPase C